MYVLTGTILSFITEAMRERWQARLKKLACVFGSSFSLGLGNMHDRSTRFFSATHPEGRQQRLTMALVCCSGGQSECEVEPVADLQLRMSDAHHSQARMRSSTAYARPLSWQHRYVKHAELTP